MKKVGGILLYFHIWVFVINPTVRVHIYPLYVVGGNSKIFSIFSPRMFGEDFVPFWRAGIFFQWVGWNHQLVIQWPPCCNGKCGAGWLMSSKPCFCFCDFTWFVCFRGIPPPSIGWESYQGLASNWTAGLQQAMLGSESVLFVFLGRGFKDFLFSPLLGEMIQFD